MSNYYGWLNAYTLPTKRFVCGHCSADISSHIGYSNSRSWQNAYVCHNCSCITNFGKIDDPFYQAPAASFGEEVEHISSSDVQSLYNEARNCMKVNAYTASVLCCRKLLMNIAVSKGASANLRFVDYVDFLENKGYFTPEHRDWVDHIRRKGNEATHEVAIMNREESEELIIFTTMLLRLIYEFPEKMRLRNSSTATRPSTGTGSGTSP